jgi:hypothetical protein
LASFLATVSSAAASNRQASVFEDDTTLETNPDATMQEFRHLGVQTVRLAIRWSKIAPSPNSRKQPNFNAADPNAYPRGAWSIYDRIVADARTDGIQLMFVPGGYAPLWAQGANPGKYGAHYDPRFAFMPSASAFKLFAEAVGTRYPTVHLWELYNEPNFGEDLAPQAINGSRILYAPVMYRALAGAEWGALHATGHGRDAILLGALAARGAQVTSNRSSGGLPGAYGETKPLDFIRELYCLDPHYHAYRGDAAAARKCPTTSAAAGQFRGQNPALFSATGWSVHPYPLTNDSNSPPNTTRYHDPSYVTFLQLPNMASALDRIQRVYNSSKRFPVWNTEFGYITNPPNADPTHPDVSPATQAYYDNWAEYLSWRNSRIASTMQFLLYDPNPVIGTPECGGFASGLIFYPTTLPTPGCTPIPFGVPKPGYGAYRLPIYMPTSSARRGNALTVWGCVRPAHYAFLDTHKAQTAQIQFRSGSRGAWSTVATVTLGSSASCYFTKSVKFPTSGSVRLTWSYPAGDAKLEPTINSNYIDPLMPSLSRTVSVKIT